MEGKIDVEQFLSLLVEFDEEVETRGSGLIHCLQGANRSGVVLVAYLMGKCGCTLVDARRYACRLRPIIDISDPKHGNTVTPITFLGGLGDEIT